MICKRNELLLFVGIPGNFDYFFCYSDGKMIYF